MMSSTSDPHTRPHIYVDMRTSNDYVAIPASRRVVSAWPIIIIDYDATGLPIGVRVDDVMDKPDPMPEISEIERVA